MASLDKASEKFKPCTNSLYRRYKSFDFKSIRPVTVASTKISLKQIGSHITSIIINGNELLYDDDQVVLNLVVKFCPNLESISILGINIHNKTVKKMIEAFPKIKTIEFIAGFIYESDMRFEKLMATASLNKLNLRKNYEILGRCICTIKNLVSIDLSYCKRLQPYYFNIFCLNNKALVQLNIVRCHGLTVRSIKDITSHLLNLEDLCISSSYNNWKPTDTLELANLPKLKKLTIVFNRSESIDNLLTTLATKDLLEYLDISGNSKLTMNTIDALVSCKKLKILKLNKCYNFDDQMLTRLEENLNELHIAQCFRVTTACLINFVERSPNIRILDITDCVHIENDFYYSVSASLTQQNRKHYLTVFVDGTVLTILELYPESETVAKYLPWIKLKFSKNEKLQLFLNAKETESKLFLILFLSKLILE